MPWSDLCCHPPSRVGYFQDRGRERVAGVHEDDVDGIQYLSVVQPFKKLCEGGVHRFDRRHHFRLKPSQHEP